MQLFGFSILYTFFRCIKYLNDHWTKQVLASVSVFSGYVDSVG